MKMCYKKSFGAEFHISATTISGIWGAREEKLSFAKFRLIANIFNISYRCFTSKHTNDPIVLKILMQLNFKQV